ncbi:hypothetical protein WOLCODRAFT_166864 [Wolfiporia cocos MD-104 SS10]|uniref:F-box domain-containing protein n=1 Tax=Wolfiporia cocos (strain MD-104) TaxID=742152 RepID=A0A2H3J976_WOLCO|nr:hypothetical protein WOLCODRAFT_166864 [Wolfiporia cocos MD-104 SS10]
MATTTAGVAASHEKSLGDANMSTKEHRRAQIEAEITRLNQCVVKLKSELNMLSPISVLPQEILAEIFITLSEAVGHNVDQYPHPGRRHDVRFLITHDNSFQDFFDALENMPLLEILELEHAAPSLPLSATEIPAPTRIITLTRLHSIRLSAMLADCIYVLSHLSFPALSTFSLKTPEYTKELAKCLADKVPFWERICMLDCSRKPSGLFKIQGSDSQVGFPDVKEDYSDPQYTFNLSFFTWGKTVPTIMCKHIPWRMVRTLVVSSLSYGEACEWIAAFRLSNQVTTLKAGRPTAASRETSMKLFPLLRSISLSDQRFAEPETYDLGLVGELIEPLLDRLARRRDQGVKIRKLQITNCFNIDHRDIERLREIVPSIDWDGQVIHHEPEYGTDDSSESDSDEETDPFESDSLSEDPEIHG